jgi:RNA polymerase sigma factor (sigma-70 family)
MTTENIGTFSSALCETMYQQLLQIEEPDIAGEVIAKVMPLLQEFTAHVVYLARNQRINAYRTEEQFIFCDSPTLEFLIARCRNSESGGLVHKSEESEIPRREEHQELASALGPMVTKRIDQVIKSLSPNEALVVLARELFDMSYTEIAEILYKTEGNIRKTYSQGKRRLGEKVR